MVKILLTGCNGRMGRAISELAEASSGMAEVVAGVDINPSMINHRYPVFPKLSDFTGKADVVVDFSHHSLIESLLEYAESSHLPLVVATTGHNDDEKALIAQAVTKMPIFMSANMSLGVNLLLELSAKAAALLGDSFDIEIIEKHHAKKLDAPSGTAIMIANAISGALKEPPTLEYDRHSRRTERPKNEIGIHAIRGGTIVGDHEVLFAGREEQFTLSHSATSREVFASGALKAAVYMKNKPAGLYTMKELLSEAIVK